MDFNTFSDRLDFILQGRKANPWAKTLGFSSGTVTRMKESVVPGQDVLTAIMRADNVNLSWLLGGSGQPFMVDTHLFEGSFLRQLRLHANDCMDYDVHFISDEVIDVSVVVFSQPASFTFKKTCVIYHQIEILAAPYTPRLAMFIGELVHEGTYHIWQPNLTELEIRKLATGQMGSYTLLGELGTDDRMGHTGILHRA